MAYYSADEEDQKPPGAEGQPAAQGQGQSSVVQSGGSPGAEPQASSQPPVQSAASGVVGSGSAGAPAPAGGSPSKSPSASGASPFVGISDYLNANKSQSQKYANNVGNYVTGVGNQAREGLKNAQGQFDQDVKKNTTNFDQGLANEAYYDSAKVASDPTRKQQFQQGLNAQYQGPQDLESQSYFKPINDLVKKAQTTGDLTKDVEGQKQLIDTLQQQQRGKVSKGATAFDSLLLQAAPNARDALTKAREGLSDIPGSVEKAKQDAKTEAQQAAATTAATKAAYQRVGEAAPALQKDLAARAATKQAQAQDVNDQLRAALGGIRGGNRLTDSQISQLGMSPQQYDQMVQSAQDDTSLAGFDFSPFLKSTPTYNAQNVATGEEQARLSALADLMGGGFTAGPQATNTPNFDLSSVQSNIPQVPQFNSSNALTGGAPSLNASGGQEGVHTTPLGDTINHLATFVPGQGQGVSERSKKLQKGRI